MPRLIPTPGLLVGLLLAVCIQSSAFPDTVDKSLGLPGIYQLQGDLSQGIDPGEELVPSATSIETSHDLDVAMDRTSILETPFRQYIRLSARSPPAFS